MWFQRDAGTAFRGWPAVHLYAVHTSADGIVSRMLTMSRVGPAQREWVAAAGCGGWGGTDAPARGLCCSQVNREDVWLAIPT